MLRCTVSISIDQLTHSRSDTELGDWKYIATDLMSANRHKFLLIATYQNQALIVLIHFILILCHEIVTSSLIRRPAWCRKWWLWLNYECSLQLQRKIHGCISCTHPCRSNSGSSSIVFWEEWQKTWQPVFHFICQLVLRWRCLGARPAQEVCHLKHDPKVMNFLFQWTPFMLQTNRYCWKWYFSSMHGLMSHSSGVDFRSTALRLHQHFFCNRILIVKTNGAVSNAAYWRCFLYRLLMN